MNSQKTTKNTLTLKPAFTKNTIPIVFAANNGFVPMFAACLQSLIDHLNSKYNYDVILIQSDVSDENKSALLSMVEPYKNLSLRFYDATPLLQGYHLKANAHISVETYYRFLIQGAMPDYHKVLYIDCDLIINGDISELYNTDIEDYMLAAARDPDFLGQINGATPETMEYIKTDFKMKNPFDYFQAGVLLFNEDEMRAAHSLDEWLTFASTPYRYNDQDVLNLHCEGHVKFLDMEWNMIVDCNHERVAKIISHAPADIQSAYAKAHTDPKIIHYAGFMKPWYGPTEDYAHEFWHYARKTPYYEELLVHMVKFTIKSEQVAYTGNYPSPSFTKRAATKIYHAAFPQGSKRWQITRKLRGKGNHD